MPKALLRNLAEGLRDLWQSAAPAPVASPEPEQGPPEKAVPEKPAPDRGTGTSPGLICDLEANSIKLGKNITLVGDIRGTGNVIEIAGTRQPQTLVVSIHGHDNRIVIGKQALLANLRVDIGARRWTCSGARLTIGEFFSVGSRSRIILSNSGNVVEIGNNCMFSKSIMVRGGEYPHLIFDKASGDYLDVSDGIFIGDHAWIGEGAYITKAVTVPRECIVGARSVVTKRFDVENAVIAGNPAKIVKVGVQWIANEIYLEEFPECRAGFEASTLAALNRTYPQGTPVRTAEQVAAEQDGKDIP